MSAYYTRDGEPVADYQAAFPTGSFDSDCRVELTEGSGFEVSTVFLGVNYNWGTGKPLIFETMVFGGPLDQECWRYSTEAEAKAGHATVVDKCRAAAQAVSA